MSLSATAISIILSLAGSEDVLSIYICSFLFGFVTFPIFSVAAAHANDFAEQDKKSKAAEETGDKSGESGSEADASGSDAPKTE